MKTLTLRIDSELARWIGDEARRMGRTRSEIIRDALRQQRDGERPPSVHDIMKEYCGMIKGGPRDVSSNMKKHLKGFGE